MTMRRMMQVLRFLVFFLLLFSVVATAIFSIYLSKMPTEGFDRKHTYTAGDAWHLMTQKPLSVMTNAASLTPDERVEIFSYGNPLIYFVSTIAVVFSTLAVSTKLALIEQLVPYQKFDLWYRFLFRALAIGTISPRFNAGYERIRSQAYKNLAVRWMVFFYGSAETIRIISGDFSWLFDNDWSAQVREIIAGKIPHGVYLISYKSPMELAQSWAHYPDARKCKEIFRAVVFAVDAQHQKGSVVRTNSTVNYLYLYREQFRSVRRDSVCVFYGDREAGELVAVVEEKLRLLYQSALDDTDTLGQRDRIASDPDYFDQ